MTFKNILWNPHTQNYYFPLKELQEQKISVYIRQFCRAGRGFEILFK